MFSKSSSGIVRLNCIATMIPKNHKTSKSSTIDGSVCKNISAKMIVKVFAKKIIKLASKPKFEANK